MTVERQGLGALGERLAAAHLAAKGYEILERNFRCPEGEIDIVARKGELLAFIEVKARRGRAMGTPEEAVGYRKRRRLQRVAEAYLAAHPDSPAQCRIDVVAVEFAGGRLARLEHIEGAFDAL